VPKLDAAFDTPQAKRQYNRTLFSTIADRYDLITALLSYGQDARWKKTLVAMANVREGERALDLAAGTGDIAFAVAARGARTVALDLTHRMLQLARQKSRAASFITADMTSLPFHGSSFDLVTTGYGLRNVPDLNAAIDEIARVLKPGGRLLSLDFNRPENAVVRAMYLSYLTIVGSTLGWVLHRDPDTYRYIPASIRRYPGAHGVADRLQSRGFTEVRVIPLLFGLMSLHIAVRRQ
jgi:demethylmenaquinone methyltransferase/2-methoxy-6-polyprenyl-1,4-benzoquinol methylase